MKVLNNYERHIQMEMEWIDIMTRYQQGYAFEKWLQRRFEARGFFCMRSSGSHTPVDLSAHKDELHLFMQLKDTKEDLPNLNQIFADANRMRSLPIPRQQGHHTCLVVIRCGLYKSHPLVYEWNYNLNYWKETDALEQLGIFDKIPKKNAFEEMNAFDEVLNKSLK